MPLVRDGAKGFSSKGFNTFSPDGWVSAAPCGSQGVVIVPAIRVFISQVSEKPSAEASLASLLPHQRSRSEDVSAV